MKACKQLIKAKQPPATAAVAEGHLRLGYRLQPGKRERLMALWGRVFQAALHPKVTHFLSNPLEDDTIPSSAAERDILRQRVDAFCCRRQSWSRFMWKEMAPPEVPHLHGCVW